MNNNPALHPTAATRGERSAAWAARKAAACRCARGKGTCAAHSRGRVAGRPAQAMQRAIEAARVAAAKPAHVRAADRDGERLANTPSVAGPTSAPPAAAP